MKEVGGGETISAAAVLETDDFFCPLNYNVFSDRLPLRRATFDDKAAEITLTDDTTFPLKLSSRPDLVLQHNVLGQVAIFLSLFSPAESSLIESIYFSPEAVAVRPLKFEKVEQDDAVEGHAPPGFRWHSSLGADLYCDAENRLRRLVIESAKVKGEFADSPFPQVDFASLSRPRESTYSQSPNAGFRLEDVIIQTGEVGLGAALTRPAHTFDGTYPAALFIQGSGKHDRHGMAPGIDTGTHQIVDYLSQNGYVALRYDSRGSGGTKYGQLLDSGYETLRADARATFRFLRARPEVSQEKMFVIGHSLGALTALHLALDPETPPIRGLILLAPPGRPFDQILTEQSVREARRLGFTGEQISERRKKLREYFDRLREGGREIEGKKPSATFSGIHVGLIRDLLRIDPTELLVEVSIPILICQGGKDIQVSLKRDMMRLIAAAGKASESVNVEARIFPDLDHLFKVETGVSTPERYYVNRPIGKTFLPSLLSWLNFQCVATDGVG